ncbi:MAG: hypothetical protein L6R42_009061 [Xanthoria sp. 1 TBL-2021]|nr:MAG: hypothetical protein L6R42_009061 [Xanthoria sp. 1 TBL-2021]
MTRPKRSGIVLQLAIAILEVEYFSGADVFGRRRQCFIFANLVFSGDTNINSALADERWYVGSRKENEGSWVVLDWGDILSVLSSELNVGPSKDGKGYFVKPTSVGPISNFFMTPQLAPLTFGHSEQHSALPRLNMKSAAGPKLRIITFLLLDDFDGDTYSLTKSMLSNEFG